MKQPKVLIGGIGNIFHGDDGFGVEVAKRLLAERFPEDVRVVDFGIRGYDFAFALLDGYETTIIVDAVHRGGAPGTLYLIEVDPKDVVGDGGPADAHAMNPSRVVQFAKQLGGPMGRVLLLGCEAESFGSEEEGAMGLSPAVEAAVEPALGRIRGLVESILACEALAN